MTKKLKLLLFMESPVTVLALCIIINHVAVYGYGNCDKLKVFQGKQEIESSSFCTAEFSDEECIPLVQSFNRIHLPDVFPSNSVTVDRPSGINLVGLVNDFNSTKENVLYKVPGARVEWNSPIAEISRKHLEGFLLVWNKGNISTMCRLFKFATSSPQLSEMMTFSYDIEQLSDDSTYTFTVFSVPLPLVQYRHDSNRFVHMIMHTFQKYRHAADPVDWAPSVSIKTWPYGSIEVKFTLSPPEFNFTNFEIQLLKASKSQVNYFKKKSYPGQLFTISQPEGKVIFDNLTTDSYQVKVRIKDPFRQKEGKCFCYRKCSYYVGITCFDGRHCENSCKVTSTQFFNLTVTETPTTTITATTLADDNSTMPWSTDDNWIIPRSGEVSLRGDTLTVGEIIGISVGSFIAVILLLSFILFYWKPYCVSGFLKTKLCVKRVPHAEKKTMFGFTTQPYESNARLIPKKLYIMSGDDHNYHIQMVESLVQFLELHCHCQVVYPPGAQDIHKFDSPYSWFISNISNSDHIIFVNSVGAEKLIEAHLAQKMYRDRELRPEGDLFTECLKYIFKDNKARDKVINIFFGSFPREVSYITSPFTFAIPKNLPEFVLKIHALNSKDKRIYSSKLPMSRDNFPDLPAGAELLEAIDSSRLYEEGNPDWLIQSFGEASDILISLPASPVSPIISEISFTSSRIPPKLEKMISIDSGVNDMGPRSVSASDLNNFRCPKSAGDLSELCNNMGYCTDKELQLSIFTVQCPRYSNELSGKSCEGVKTECDNYNIPPNITAGNTINFPHSDSTLHFTASTEDYSAFVQPACCVSIIPPDDISLGVDSINAELTRINELMVANMGSRFYCEQNQMPANTLSIRSPETMSSVTNMSEAFMNINRINDYFPV